MKKSSNKGFTLVELIIVIAILAIIMLIAIPNFSGIQQRMQVRADKSTAAQIGKAVRVWFTDYTTDENMLASTKAQTDGKAVASGGGGHDLAPITTDTKTVGAVTFNKITFADTGDVTPHKYDNLVTIDEYISRGQKPTSLRTNNVQDTKQFYGVFFTAAPSSTAAKIAVAVATETESLTTVTITKDATTNKILDNYDGTKPGVAYIEP